MITLENLEIEIANEIRNYRKEELSFTIDDEHVDKWVKQFDKDSRVPILNEMKHLINQLYIKKSDIKQYIDEILSETKIFTNNPQNELKKIQFLDIQSKGSSQTNLLKLLNDKVFKSYSTKININNSTQISKYIYIDDGLFSGSTLRHDIEKWVETANENTELHIIFLCVYSNGYWYSEKKIKELCAPHNINVNFWWCAKLDNFTKNNYGILNYDCFWPQQVSDENCDDYMLSLQTEASSKGYATFKGYRNFSCTSSIFSSDISRSILESEFMKAGSYIMTLPNEKNTSMRPMGYDYLTSVGFGAFFVSYLNISNNCPLALWWGDSTKPNSHPFSKWYPLFPRKPNESGGNFIEW
ncbi:MAG: hypothetical protein H2184_00150 [Candidatus Galacturonibacter soehngenii]|nr:hypothetical protein [Candidatus Galacturonibacter soehngenii]